VLDLLLVAGVIFAVNLLPALGPPTWAMLIFLRLNLDIAAVPLVLVGALAAAAGRLVLATAARRLRARLSPERVHHLDALRDAATEHRAGAVAGIGLFALSPIPSAQLFLGAGVTGVPLLPLTAAFFTGRLVSYSLYVGAATAAEQSLRPLITDALSSPWAIGAQVLLLAAVVGLTRVPWADVLSRHRRPRRGLPLGHQR
jgi:uncharacterized membrane protein YdjX (TVP38/TMEM64 family)